MAQNDQKIAELYGEFKLKFDNLQKRLDVLKEKTSKAAEESGKKAGSKFQNEFSKYIKTIGAQLAGIFAVQKILGWIGGLMQAQDEVQKLSIRLGETTEFLSEMQHVADLSGVSVEELNSAIERGNRNLAEFAETGAGEASDAFTKLGIEAKNSEGKLKSFEELLPEYAKGFAGIADNSTKVNLAFKLFGRSGTSMLQIFDAGADGIEAMREEARKLNISLSRDVVDKTADVNDAIGTMKKALNGLGYTFISVMADPLKNFTDGLTDLFIELNVVANRFKKFADRIKFIFSGKEGLGYLGNYFKNLVKTGDVNKALDATEKLYEEYFENLEKLKNKYKNKEGAGGGGGKSNTPLADMFSNAASTPALNFSTEYIENHNKALIDTIKVYQDYKNNIKEVETEYFTLIDTFDEVQEASSEFYAGLMADTQGYMEAGNMMFESMMTGFMTMFEDMTKIQTSSNNTLVKGFVAMANSFIQQVQRMIAQWLAFKAIQAGLNLLVPGSGDLWAKLASKNAQTGAEFYVPPGYPNDTYMMGVSSGEHVQVTPSSQPNNQEKLLQKMISRLDILASYANTPQGVQGVNVTGKIDGYDIKLAYDKMNRLVNKVS